MRLLALTTASVALLSGCVTSQENPNYEFSSRYKGDPAATHQYADAVPVEVTATTYETAPSQPIFVDMSAPAATAPDMGAAPTDSAFAATEMAGTPGFMATQAAQIDNPAQGYPTAESAPITPSAAMPVEYDLSQNMVSIGADTTGAEPAEIIQSVPSFAGTPTQTYIVKTGDTVYSLSRSTCVGVNVIKSMNGLDADYGINIGQSLRLPTSIC